MMSVSEIGFEHLVHFACMRHLAPLWGVSRPLVSPDHRRNRLRPDVIAIDGRAGATISLSCGLARGVQAKDKAIDFDAGRPGCRGLRQSLLSRLLGAFCLNSERARAPYNEGVHWPRLCSGPVGRGGCTLSAKGTKPAKSDRYQNPLAYGQCPVLDGRVIVRLLVSSLPTGMIRRVAKRT